MSLIELQIRRDIAANWASANPTLMTGEPGLETDTGRWKYGNGASVWTSLPYQQMGVYDVRLFGATGNGSTDDHAAIQSAITAASVSGGIVVFPPGTYVTSAALVIAGSGVVLRGAGRLTSTIKASSSFPDASNGVVQYTTGASVFSGCGIYDLGFDTTACTTTTKNHSNAIYQNSSVPLQHFNAERLHFNLNPYTQGILFNSLGVSPGSYDLTFRDIDAINGAGTVSCYNNGVTQGSLMSEITIDNVYNLCNSALMQDDRIAIVSSNGGGGASVETRNVSISNIYTEVVAPAAGTINGVKLDMGLGGYLHDVSVRNVWFDSIATITNNQPVLCFHAASAHMGNVSVENVYGNNCGPVVMRLDRTDPNPYVKINNVHINNGVGTRMVEVITTQAPVGDESVVIENCYLHTAASINGNYPVGVMLTSGSSGQGLTGMTHIRNVSVAGSVSTGISNTVNEAGNIQASAWSNILVSDCSFGAASVATNLVNTYTVNTGFAIDGGTP